MKKITFALCLLQFICITLNAQWSTPITVLPNVAQPSYIEGDEELTTPVIEAITDNKGVLHIVWSDYAAGVNEIYYSSRTNANSPFSAPMNLSNSANNYSIFPDIVAAPSGEVMVSWTEINQDYSESSIQARMLNPDGIWGNKVTIEQPEKLLLFSSGAFINGGSIFMVAYNDIILDGDGDVLTQELGIARIDFSSGTVVDIDEPTASPENSAFRPQLLNQGADIIHCVWYDEIGEDSDYIKYAAYSAFQNGSWGTTTPLSQQSSTFLSDDGPIHLLLDKDQNLYAIWMSFIPEKVGQMAIKPVQSAEFGVPTNITDLAVFNGVFYFDQANQLNMLHPINQGLTYLKIENDSLITQGMLVPSDSEVYFPAVHTVGDTAHLFWAQDNTLQYSTNIGVSGTKKLMIQPVVKAYPTAGHGTVYFSAEKNIINLHIVSSKGQVVFEQPFVGTPSTIVHLEQMPSGKYVATLTLEGGEQVARALFILK